MSGARVSPRGPFATKTSRTLGEVEMTKKQTQTLVVAAAIVVAFLAGFVWQYARATSLARELRATQEELAVQRLEATFAAATVHAYYGNYELARQLTSQFFTDAAALPAAAPPAAHEKVASLQAQRDALITSLARGNPESAEVLADHFIQLRVALGGPEGS